MPIRLESKATLGVRGDDHAVPWQGTDQRNTETARTLENSGAYWRTRRSHRAVNGDPYLPSRSGTGRQPARPVSRQHSKGSGGAESYGLPAIVELRVRADAIGWSSLWGHQSIQDRCPQAVCSAAAGGAGTSGSAPHRPPPQSGSRPLSATSAEIENAAGQTPRLSLQHLGARTTCCDRNNVAAIYGRRTAESV